MVDNPVENFDMPDDCDLGVTPLANLFEFIEKMWKAKGMMVEPTPYRLADWCLEDVDSPLDL